MTHTVPTAGDAPARSPLTPALRRTLVTLLAANLSVFCVWGATTGVMLQAQVESIDAASKEAGYALVAGLGAAVALVAQPVAGIVSDRTRSRFGRRAPWMVAGALVGALMLVGLGTASTVLQLALAWCGVQLALNVVQGPLSAVLPDRVPASRRGIFSSAMGLGLLVGMIGGQVVGAALVPHFLRGYAVLGGVVVVAVVAFVLINPEPSSVGLPRERFRAADLLRTFWVNPVAHPDFAWAFTGRFLLNTGMTLTTTYSYFLLQEYVGLDRGEALAVVPVVAAVGALGSILTTPVAGPLSDRVGRRRPFVFAAATIVAAGLAIPLVWPTVAGVVVYAFVAGLGSGMFQAVDTALITQVLPSADDYGKDLGVVNIAATLPQAIAPALAGLVVLQLGGYGALFPVAMALVLLGGLSVWRIRSVA